MQCCMESEACLVAAQVVEQEVHVAQYRADALHLAGVGGGSLCQRVDQLQVLEEQFAVQPQQRRLEVCRQARPPSVPLPEGQGLQ